MRSKSEGTTGGRTAPSLVDPEPLVVPRQPPDPGSTPPESKPPSFLNWTRVFRLVVKKLSNLQLAIAELALIAALSAVGTIIDQNQSVETYVQNYPDGPEKVLGFLSWQWVLRLQLDHIYTSWYFLTLLAVFAASLVACTYSQQWPIVKIARRWRYARTPESVYKRGNGELLPNARIQDLGILLRDKGYKVFLEREKDQSVLYGFKGMAGRYSPIGVHAAMLLVLAGVCWGGLGGSTGSLMAPPGAQVLVADVLRPALPFAPLPDGASTVLTIQDFTIDYRADGSISQYYTDLVATDLDGYVLKQKSISVNDPFRIGGVTMYQTDWSMAALIVHPAPGSASNSFPAEGLSLPMADLDQALGMNARGKLYGTFLPLEAISDRDGAGAPRGVSMVARDLESVVIYDSTGQFVGVRRPGSGLPIKVEGVELVVDEVIGSSGLELKTDPGVPLVYTGFGAMMLTTMLSYISHSQVWALQQGTQLHVGGRTNRAKIAFESELSDLLDEVPEYAPDSS